MATQQIRGLDDALKTLQKMDPVLRREAVKRLKNDVNPIVSAIKAGLPKAPLSNWVAPKQSSARRGTVSAADVTLVHAALASHDANRARRVRNQLPLAFKHVFESCLAECVEEILSCIAAHLLIFEISRK